MVESVHDSLNRVRKPRVHITYDVETEGATEMKELPFVIGVMGDFSGDSKLSKKPFKERKFIDLKKDNFDHVMARIEPGVTLKVENTLEKNGKEFQVDLTFRSIADFEPESLVQQIEPLRKLLETRDALRDLMAKADGSEKLEGLLEHILQNPESLAALGVETGAIETPKE